MDDRFWSKVRRGSPDECWPWAAGKDEKGYGMFLTAAYFAIIGKTWSRVNV